MYHQNVKSVLKHVTLQKLFMEVLYKGLLQMDKSMG